MVEAPRNYDNRTNVYSEISTLPENLKQEVIDFVDFLKSKSKEVLKERVFEKSKGKYILSEDFDAPLDDFKDFRI